MPTLIAMRTKVHPVGGNGGSGLSLPIFQTLLKSLIIRRLKGNTAQQTAQHDWLLGGTMGKYRIMDHNLKPRGRQWHYIRRIPDDVQQQLGKKRIEKSLKTRDKATARRRRDVEDQVNEKLWEQIRRAKDAGRLSYSNDPRVEALQEFQAFRASDVARNEDATHPDEPYAEKLEVLLEVIADTHRLDLGDKADTKEAMRLLRDTPDGRMLIEVFGASQGSVTIDLAGEDYLKSASQAPDTKRLYLGVYMRAAHSDLRKMTAVDEFDGTSSPTFDDTQLLNMSWREAKKQCMDETPKDEAWEEKMAREWARRFAKTFGKKPAEQPRVMAMALEIYSDPLVHKLCEEWRDHLDDAKEAAEDADGAEE